MKLIDSHKHSVKVAKSLPTKVVKENADNPSLIDKEIYKQEYKRRTRRQNGPK